MTINISQLPIATEADLRRVGQHLWGTMSFICRIDRDALRQPNATILADVDYHYDLGRHASVWDRSGYRLLTEAQAIELAKAMPHVWPEWEATWPKVEGPGLPPYDSLAVGDSFDVVTGKQIHRGHRWTLTSRKGDDWTCSSGKKVGYICREVWTAGNAYANFKRAESTVIPAFVDVRVGDSFDFVDPLGTKRFVVKQTTNGVIVGASDSGWGVSLSEADWMTDKVRNFKAANVTNTGELMLRQMAELERERIQNEPHPGYVNRLVDKHTGPTGIEIGDRTVAELMAHENDAYAERQERDKQNILREMLKPHRPGTNGLGSISCVMRGRR